MNVFVSFLSVFLLAVMSCEAFVSPAKSARGVAFTAPTTPSSLYQPAALQRQRKSVASVQTMGLFGLGAPEIAIILVAAAFLLGPQKLAELGKDAGKIAGELKEVPKEFQKGMEEGESEAKAMKAKIMEEEKAEDAETE